MTEASNGADGLEMDRSLVSAFRIHRFLCFIRVSPEPAPSKDEFCLMVVGWQVIFERIKPGSGPKLKTGWLNVY